MYLLVEVCILGFISYAQCHTNGHFVLNRTRRDYSPSIWNTYKPLYHHNHHTPPIYDKPKWSIPYNSGCGSLLPSIHPSSLYYHNDYYTHPTSSGPPSSYYPNPSYVPSVYDGLPPPKIPPTFYDAPPDTNTTTMSPPQPTTGSNSTSTTAGYYLPPTFYPTYAPPEVPHPPHHGYYYPEPPGHYPHPSYGPPAPPAPPSYHHKYHSYFWPSGGHPKPHNNQQQVVYIQQPNILPILPIPPPGDGNGNGFLPTGNSNKMFAKSTTVKSIAQDEDNQIEELTPKNEGGNFDTENISNSMTTEEKNIGNTFQTQWVNKNEGRDMKRYPVFNGTASKF